jgi:hypothetical protein
VGNLWGQNLDHTMVAHMLSFNSGSYSSGMLHFMGHAGVLKSCSFAFGFLPCFRGVTTLEVLVLHWGHLATVLLRENFPVLNRLNGCVVMVLADLPVYGFLDWT